MNRSMILGLLLVSLAPTLFAAELAMFDKTKTYCFGRYLVDIPAEVVLKDQGNAYYLTSIKSGKGMADFTTKMNAALAKRKNEPGKHGFKYVKSVYPEGGDRQIVVAKAELWGTFAYSIDAFVRMSSQKVGAGSFFYLSEDGLSASNIDAIVANYRTILAATRYRAEREIPSESGFCIENGFIANDGKTPQVEMANLAFRLKNNQDVRIRIESEVRFKPWPSLLERQKQAKLDERYPGQFKKVRSGQLTVNGLAGDESLMVFPSDDRTGEAHNFTWETLGEENNPLKPDIVLKITSGEGVAGVTGVSSMSTKEIQALYETIVKTIRIRPTGGHDKTSDAAPDTPQAPARLPLGSKVASGRPCPEAGLWQCVHPQATPRQVTLKVGQLMPSVLVPNPRSLWQRLKGAPQELAIDSEWALVQYG